MTTLENFYKSIENDEIVKPKKDLYLESVKNLYPGIWTDEKVLQHIKLLKDKKPVAKWTDFDTWMEEDPYSYAPLDADEWLTERQEELYREAFNAQPKTRTLDPNDLKISKILKLRVQGASITISPAKNTISWEELLKKTKTIKDCKYITDAEYFIEFHTDGNPTGDKPHIHMYAHLTHIDKVNNVASYIRKKFPKTSCEIVKKQDITYGVQDYLIGKASKDAKKKYKKLDKSKRLSLNIPDILNL